MLSSGFPIGQLNKPLLTNDNCETVHTKLERYFGLNGPLCFSTSAILGSHCRALLCQLSHENMDQQHQKIFLKIEQF